MATGTAATATPEPMSPMYGYILKIPEVGLGTPDASLPPLG
jgi:hypothetical protein